MKWLIPLFVGALAFASLIATAQEVQPPAPPAPVAGADARLFELRIYYPEPGKLAALNDRFRQHTTKLFARHGMDNIAYWNDAPSADAPEGRIVYVLAFPDRASRDAAWAAFVADPEWQTVAKASEANGKLVKKIDSIFMTATDYSPGIAGAE
ncbi:NIPSNAP family protein [Sphingomonas sp. CJ99]